MIKILLDTNAYTAFKRGHEAVCEIIRHAHTLALNSVALGELRGGFAVGNKEEWNLHELQDFLSRSRVRQLPVDDTTAKYYAQIYKQLRAKGKPIPTNDLWIAASALQYQLPLLTFDEHFKEIDELCVGRCLQDFQLQKN